jgi:hypothetical protein
MDLKPKAVRWGSAPGPTAAPPCGKKTSFRLEGLQDLRDLQDRSGRRVR